MIQLFLFLYTYELDVYRTFIIYRIFIISNNMSFKKVDCKYNWVKEILK